MRDRWFGRMLYREWLANRNAHTIVIAVVALTFLMYCIYGAWAGDDPSVQRARSLDVGVPLLVYYPDWTAPIVNPQFTVENVTEAPGVSRMRPGVVTRLQTPVGTADAWGIDLDDGRLLTSFDVREGSLPEPGAGAVAVSRVLAEEADLTVGGEMALSHVDPNSGARRTETFGISGIISVDDAWSRLVVGDAGQFSELAGLPRFNAAWIWSERIRRGHRMVDVDVPGTVAERLPRVRAPSYPYYMSPLGETAGENPHLGSFGGVPSPFLHRVGPVIWHGDAVRGQVEAMSRTGIASVSGLVTLMFLMVALALTLTVLIIVLDRQRIIGIYAVLGMSPEDIGRMFRSQLVLDASLGTVLGFFLFVLTAALLELPLVIPPLTLILWGVFQVALVCWGGRVAWVLSGDRDLRSHLRGDSNFDWWKLIDVWPRPVGPERRSEQQ